MPRLVVYCHERPMGDSGVDEGRLVVVDFVKRFAFIPGRLEAAAMYPALIRICFLS